MFKITNRQDAINFIQTFGVTAMRYALAKGTLDPDSVRSFHDLMKIASSRKVEIANFNDGNNEWSIDLVFTENWVLGKEEDENIMIVRTGFGAGTWHYSEGIMEVNPDDFAIAWLKAHEIKKLYNLLIGND